MKITKAITGAIVSVETKKKFYDLKKDAEDALREECKRLAIKLYPKIKIPQELIDASYVRTTTYVYFKYKSGVTSDYYKDVSVDTGYAYPIPYTEKGHNLKYEGKLKALHEKTLQLLAEEKKFKADLEKVIQSFTNHKSLLVHLPELANHFKDADNAKNMALVPVEVIKSVRKEIVRP